MLACALSFFRTADGGKTWEKVLFVDENTGCSDMGMDPNNPRILYAGMWQIEIHTWGRTSGGAGSGLFKSTDGGITWNAWRGMAYHVRVAKKDSNRVYAEIKTGDGVPQLNSPGQLGQLWRSDDGGENWEMVNSDRQLRGRTHYYPRTEIAPDNAGPPPPFPPVCPRGPWESTAPIVPTDRANLPWDARTPLRTDFAAFGTSRETAGLQDCER